MPNYCNYSMMIKGKKENCEKLISWLNADYGHRDGKEILSAEHHFFRVFECYVNDEGTIGDDYFIWCCGQCAWSVRVCMFKGERTYYDDFKDTYEHAISMDEACEELNLVVAIESEEPGMCFSERILVRNDGTYDYELVDFVEEESDEEWIGKTEDGMEVDLKYSVEEGCIKLMPQEL